MINHDRFFASVRVPLFAGSLSQGQVDGMSHLLDVWEECYTPRYPDLRFLAYALATTRHETAATMQPIEEYGKGRGRAYGHPVGPWHQVYDGRGDVQLTWEANYRHASERLAAEIGVKADLDRHPELAMEPDIAAHVMYLGMIEGWFTGKKLGDYFNARLEDALHARRIINGLDKARLIAGYFRVFRAALAVMPDMKAA
jgi:putative chitinase